MLPSPSFMPSSPIATPRSTSLSGRRKRTNQVKGELVNKPQPKMMEDSFRGVEEELEREYSARDSQPFQEDHLFESVPCAAEVSSPDGTIKWVRGVVKHLSCVFGNDLEAYKVDAFKKIIEAECKGIVRVEFTNANEPFLVNLYHPTILGQNLGQFFYRTAECEEREKAKQRKFQEHHRRMAQEESDFDDEDESDYEEMDDGSERPVMYVKNFNRMEKLNHSSGEKLRMGEVKSARMICLHTDSSLRRRSEIEKAMAKEFDTSPWLPVSWRFAGTACIVWREDWPLPKRATVLEWQGQQSKVLLIDYGSSCWITQEGLRAVHPRFADSPCLYIVSLYYSGCWLYPHPTETRILRELLQEATTVIFEAERSSKANYAKGRIIHEKFGDLNKELRLRVKKTGVSTSCRALTLCSPVAGLLLHTIDVDYEHVSSPPPFLLKGNLVVEALPPAEDFRE